MKIVKSMYIENKSGQTATIAHNGRLEYIHDMISSAEKGGSNYKVMLIKFVREQMEYPGLREAKIFVEDALGQ